MANWWGDFRDNTLDYLNKSTPFPSLEQMRRGEWDKALLGTLSYASGLTGIKGAFDQFADFSNLFLPKMPKFDAGGPSTGRFPVTVRAEGRPIPWIAGRPRVALYAMYESTDLESTTYFLGCGIGPLTRFFDAEVDGTGLFTLQGTRGAFYLGTRTQMPDPASVNVRHVEPDGTPVNLTVWDYVTHGWDPSVPPFAATSFNVRSDGGTVRVHVQGSMQLDEEQQKNIQFTVYWRPQGGGSWTNAGTYKMILPDTMAGTKDAYLVILGGDVTVSCPARFDYRAGTVPELDTDVSPTYQEVFEVTTAKGFDAGDYDLKVEFLAAERGGGDVTAARLALSAVEVEERNDALALRGLAYAVATIPQVAADHSTNFLATPAGLKFRVWRQGRWRREWTNNPVWIAAGHVTDPAGEGKAESRVDWEHAKAEATHCDGIVSTLYDFTEVSAYGPHEDGFSIMFAAGFGAGVDLGGYMAMNQEGEVLPILTSMTDGQFLEVPAAFLVPPTFISIREQRFRADVVLDVARDAAENTKAILQTCRGTRYETPDGTVRLSVERERSPVKTIKPEHLVGGISVTQRDPQERPASLLVNHRDQARNWEPNAFPVGDPDGRFDHTLDLPYVACHAQAKRLGAYEFGRLRTVWTAEVTTTLALIELETGDVVRWKEPRFGWGYDVTYPDAPVELEDDDASVRLWIVDSVRGDGEGHQTVMLREYDASIYPD